MNKAVKIWDYFNFSYPKLYNEFDRFKKSEGLQDIILQDINQQIIQICVKSQGD